MAKTTPAEGSSRQAPMISEATKCFISGLHLCNCNRRTIRASAGGKCFRYAVTCLYTGDLGKRGRQKTVPEGLGLRRATHAGDACATIQFHVSIGNRA